jgi:hypothetical protein
MKSAIISILLIAVAAPVTSAKADSGENIQQLMHRVLFVTNGSATKNFTAVPIEKVSCDTNHPCCCKVGSDSPACMSRHDCGDIGGSCGSGC